MGSRVWRSLKCLNRLNGGISIIFQVSSFEDFISRIIQLGFISLAGFAVFLLILACTWFIGIRAQRNVYPFLVYELRLFVSIICSVLIYGVFSPLLGTLLWIAVFFILKKLVWTSDNRCEAYILKKYTKYAQNKNLTAMIPMKNESINSYSFSNYLNSFGVLGAYYFTSLITVTSHGILYLVEGYLIGTSVYVFIHKSLNWIFDGLQNRSVFTPLLIGVAYYFILTVVLLLCK